MPKGGGARGQREGGVTATGLPGAQVFTPQIGKTKYTYMGNYCSALLTPPTGFPGDVGRDSLLPTVVARGKALEGGASQ